MENIFQKIKDIPDREPSRSLIKEIRGKLFILKLKPFLLAFFLLLVVSSSFSAMQVYSRILENGILTVIKVFVQDFDLDFDYLFSFISGLNETLPRIEMIALVVNLGLVTCLAKIICHYRRQIFRVY